MGGLRLFACVSSDASIRGALRSRLRRADDCGGPAAGNYGGTWLYADRRRREIAAAGGFPGGSDPGDSLGGVVSVVRAEDSPVPVITTDRDGWTAVWPFLEKMPVNYRMMLGNDAVAREFGGLNSLPARIPSWRIERRWRTGCGRY